MKETKLLKSLEAIRQSLESLERGQQLLIYYLISTEDESEGKLSHETLELENRSSNFDKGEKEGDLDFEYKSYLK